MKHLQYYTNLQDYMTKLNGKRLVSPNISLVRPEGGEDIIFKDFTTFYLFHSSDCTIEKVVASSKFGETQLNLTGFVKPGYFYGGVATDYAGKGTIATAVENGDYSAFANVNSVVDSDGEAYDCSNLKTTQNVRFFARTNMLSKVLLENNRIYYLKEVPVEPYLQSYFPIYKVDGKVVQMTVLTNIDDSYYRSPKIKITLYGGQVLEYDSLKAAASYSDTVHGFSKISAKQLAGGLVSILACGVPVLTTIPLEDGQSFSVESTWTTLDGINVSKIRTVWPGDWTVENIRTEYSSVIYS